MEDFRLQIQAQVPPEFRDVLYTNKALIYGGSLVRISLGMVVNRFKICVNIDDAYLLIKDMMGINYKIDKVRFNFQSHDDKVSEITMYTNVTKITIKVLKIPSMIFIKDLPITCLHVWYDGVNVDGTHISDTMNKFSYTTTMDSLNPYIRKYKKLGFTFTYHADLAHWRMYSKKTLSDCRKVDFIKDLLNGEEESVPWYVKTHGFTAKFFRMIY